jgi:hypothetical protein
VGALPGEPVQRANKEIVTSSLGEDKGKVIDVTTPVAMRACARNARRAAQNAHRRLCRANLVVASGTRVARGGAAIHERPTMTDDRRTRTPFHIAAAVRASISSDGLVLLDVHGGVVLASNAIGARIWQLIESRLDGVEIASRLALEYDVPAERARNDVAAFLAALEAKGLVTAEEPC